MQPQGKWSGRSTQTRCSEWRYSRLNGIDPQANGSPQLPRMSRILNKMAQFTGSVKVVERNAGLNVRNCGCHCIWDIR